MSDKPTKTKLPSIGCPCCGEKVFPLEVTFGCEKCGTLYEVDTSIFSDDIELSYVHRKRIRDYMQSLVKKNKLFERYTKNAKNDIETLTESKVGLTVSFKEDMLKAMINIKTIYKLKDLKQTVVFVVHGFMFILRTMRSLPGNKMYIIDEHGNKSKEISVSILKDAYEAFHKEKDKEVVDRFVSEMGITFKANAVKGFNKNDEQD